MYQAFLCITDESAARLRALCTALTWSIAYAGTSAADAIDRCCKVKGGVLIVDTLDRLGNAEEIVLALKQLHAAGRDLISLKERIDTTTHPAFWELLPLFVALGKIKPKRKKTNKRGPVRYGWKREEWGVVPHEKEQAILARVRKMIDEGESLRGVCRRLDEEGTRRRGGKKWTNAHRWLNDVLKREEELGQQENPEGHAE